MKRFIIEELKKWRADKYRKPLILRGARQVGKTWAMKKFGEEFESVAYFNFDENEEYKQFFSTTKDVFRIMQNLALASGQRIDKNTLIIFDEIQECDGALNALKYFCENAREYCVICAGSLLGLTLSKGFPVGKVDFLDMGPMTFSEFLIANGDKNLYEYLLSVDEISAVPDAFFNPLSENLKTYFITGGMPEPVYMWTKERSVELVDRALSGIIGSYEKDFGKHLSFDENVAKYDVQKITLIWNSLPAQLSNEKKKFTYSKVREGARAREYENNLQWLVNADIVKKVIKISKPALPISAYKEGEFFKIYHLDVGLLRSQSKLSYKAFTEGDRLFTEFKGALTENFVEQSLVRLYSSAPHYWANDKYEVDFIIQSDNDVLPVEVKSGKSVSSPSVNEYAKMYDGATPLIVRYSLKNLSLDGRVLNIPLFMIDQTKKLVELAKKQLSL